jgi:hypothetical protein
MKRLRKRNASQPKPMRVEGVSTGMQLPIEEIGGNFKLLTGATCYRINTDNGGRATGVAYYGPGGSDNTIEAELVMPRTFRCTCLKVGGNSPLGASDANGRRHLFGRIAS